MNIIHGSVCDRVVYNISEWMSCGEHFSFSFFCSVLPGERAGLLVAKRRASLFRFARATSHIDDVQWCTT